MRAALLEREDHLRAKEKECEVLWLNLAKETERCMSSEQDCDSLWVFHANVQKAKVDLCKSLETSKVAYAAEVQRVEESIVALAKRYQLHAAELAKAEERRAEEERIAEDLRG